ncbi:hypothetical protein IC619_002970 [Hazenella sp. IB182353]|uniref:hypothetical protein n=1 Tax=Polycladospora coralii TaxID=2771432 RepID=UPI001747B2D1|nr:hypothetical protein [Polycladospora coralii]MBS7529459.1 hypothetical protein [Polycladospora coralii]
MDSVIRLMQLAKTEDLGVALSHLMKWNQKDPIMLANRHFILVPHAVADDPYLLVKVAGDMYLFHDLQTESVSDPILARLGVSVFRMTEHVADDEDWANYQEGLLFLQLGIALKILKLSHDHLASRSSYGESTLSHQMVKSSFAEFLVRFQTVMSSYAYHQKSLTPAFLSFLHDETHRTRKELMSVMGGHGYIEEGTAEWGYASDLLQNLFDMRRHTSPTATQFEIATKG